MQVVRLIGGDSATDWSQHEVAGQQKKEVGKGQQETRPLAFVNIKQVQTDLTLQNIYILTSNQSYANGLRRFPKNRISANTLRRSLRDIFHLERSDFELSIKLKKIIKSLKSITSAAEKIFMSF